MRGGRVPLDFVKRDLEQGMRQRCFVDMSTRLETNIVSMSVLASVHAMLPMRSPKNFAQQSVASALRALGVEVKEAVRIATMELPVPEPLERGLLWPWTTVRVVRREASAGKPVTAS